VGIVLSLKTRRDARSLDHGTLEEMRRLAVRRIESGESQREVAESLEVHPNTVSKWMVAYRTMGAAGIASTKASGRPPKLTKRQTAQLFRIIVGKTPMQLNFGSALWTLPVVEDVIEKLFGVVLHKTTVWRLLRRLGLSPQKPVKRAFQQDEQEIVRWTTEEFPAIVAKAKRKQATLLFLDETGVHEDAAIGTTWGRRGKTPVVRLSGTRRRINVISAVSPRGRLWFRCYTHKLNAQTFEEFLCALLRDVKGEIVLILDRHPAHRAASVRRFLQENKRRLSVHFLPGYAPELNPDEHVWSALKGLFRRDPLGPEEPIHQAVHRAMTRIKADRDWVRSFFKSKSVAYVREALGW
jgi:transposase